MESSGETYEKILVNCLRFLGITSLYDIERMTFYEYTLRMKAQRLRSIDEEYAWHRQAWINREVRAEKKKGKNGSEYVYKKFENFFDYQKVVEASDEEKVNDKPPCDAVSRYKEYMKRRRENGEL